VTPNGVESLTPYPRCGRDYAAFLNCSNRRANRSRSGRSSPRLGISINDPAIPLRPSARNGPSWIFEQPVRNMDAEIRVDSDQVGIEGGMMDLRQRQAIRDDRLP
jgi:hypothetical protein